MSTRNLSRELDEAGRRIRSIGLLETFVLITRIFVMAVSACIATDALFRFPQEIRWILLVGLGVFAGWLISKRFLPALAPAVSRVKLALAVERTVPQAAGRLASGVEFSNDATMQENQFAQQVERDAVTLVPARAITQLVSMKQLKREGRAFVVVALLWITFFVVAPNLATIGIFRVLTPWVAVDWPARTGVRSMVFVTHHPKQTALAVKADLFRGDPYLEPVWVRMRRTKGESVGSWERIPLIHQSETRFERLVEAGSDVVEFQFLTRDMETRTQKVKFVDAPTMTSIIASIDPPAYARHPEQQRFDLGDGTNNRGRISESVLQGSFITIDFKPSPKIFIPTDEAKREEWIDQTFRWSGVSKDVDALIPQTNLAELDGVWKLSWQADRSRSLLVRLTDENGVQNVDDIQVTIDVVVDRPPEVLVIDPSSDETVLPTAKIPLRGSARDDIGLDRVSIDASRATSWHQELTTAQADGLRELDVQTVFDLSSANAQPGEVFEIVTVASDLFEVDGVLREANRSSPRRLRVVTRLQFEEETRNALAVIRQGAIRTDERQASLVEKDEGALTQVRPQTEIGERIASMRSMTQALRQRLDRNDVPDDATRSLIDAADDILQVAKAQSDSARNDLQTAAQMQEDSSNSSAIDQAKQKREDARVAQGEVRSELKDLSALLDKDKDAWMAARKLEKVAEAITQADDERSKAGARTIGRSREELTAEEAANLDRAAQSAKAAAQVAREAIEELKSRAEKVKKDDPARAMNLQEAAERGERESLSGRMEQTEKATQENRMDEAQRSSASAMQTVQRMIGDLANDEKARTATLKRKLASLAEAIAQLVQQAESVVDIGMGLGNLTGQDLTHAAQGASHQAARLSLNASAVADEGRAAGPNGQRIVRLVERGAEAESRAAVALGAAQQDVVVGNENLVRGLSLFGEALAAVELQEKKNEEQERQQRAQELTQQYRNLADREEGLLTATSALVGVNADRRVLVEARRLSVEQENISQAISAISESSPDVKKSATFVEATSIAVDAATRAAADLRSGPPNQATVDTEREVLEILRGLIEALSDAAKKEDDPFADDGGGGGGGGGGDQQEKPLIAPLAELKVIRSLQQRIYERTKAINSARMPADALGGLAQRQESIAKIADDLRKEVERQMKERENQVAPKFVVPKDEPPINVDPKLPDQPVE